MTFVKLKQLIKTKKSSYHLNLDSNETQLSFDFKKVFKKALKSAIVATGLSLASQCFAVTTNVINQKLATIKQAITINSDICNESKSAKRIKILGKYSYAAICDTSSQADLKNLLLSAIKNKSKSLFYELKLSNSTALKLAQLKESHDTNRILKALLLEMLQKNGKIVFQGK